MIITEFSSRKTANGSIVDTTWENFVERLKTPVVTDETLDEYKAMTNEQRTDIKDCGGYVAGEFTDGKRSKNLLKNRCVLTIDADDATPDDIDNYSCLYDSTVFVHTTHTSTDEQLRLRWLFPLSRPVTPEEYRVLAREVMEWVGVHTVDETTDQPERLMFWPSVPFDVEYYYWDLEGSVLDPDSVLDGMDLAVIEEKPTSKISSGSSSSDGELEAIQEGNRNRAVFNFLARQRDLGMDEEALHKFGLYYNERFCVPPLPEYEIRTIIGSVLKYTPGDPIPFAARDARMDFSDLGKFEKKEDGWLENGNELMERHIKPLEFIIPDILPIGLGVIFSPPKYGKSWFVLDLALAVATGTTFLGMDTNRCGTLYLALEDYDGSLKGRIASVIATGREDKSLFFHREDALPLENGLVGQLDSFINKNPSIRLIIIDTFVKIRGLAKRNEGAYDHDYKELSVLKDWVKDKDVAILLVHHTRKTLDSDDFVMNANGTSGITGAADFIYGLTRKARKDPTTVLNITGRYVRSKSYILQFNEMTNRWENLGEEKDVRETESDKAYLNDPVVKTIRALLDEAADTAEDDDDVIRRSLTSQELINAIEKGYRDERFHGNTREMGKYLNTLAPKLLDKDGITHEYVRTKTQRLHVFTMDRD